MAVFAFTYGNYSVPDGTARVSSRTVQPVVFNNYTVALKHVLQITGTIYSPDPNSPAALKTAMEELEQALSLPNQSGGLKVNGVETSHWLSSTGALGGVQVQDFAWLDSPLNMVTEAQFRLSLAATYSNTAETRDVVELKETVSIEGEGGAIVVLVPQATTQSIYQQLRPYSDVTVRQQGVITARLGPPAMPVALIQTPGARQVLGTRENRSVVQLGNGIIVHRLAYAYEFALPQHPGTLTPQVLV